MNKLILLIAAAFISSSSTYASEDIETNESVQELVETRELISQADAPPSLIMSPSMMFKNVSQDEFKVVGPEGSVVLSMKGNVIHFNALFMPAELALLESAIGLVNAVQEKGEKALLVITSSGGAITEGFRVLDGMDKTDVRFDTYVPSMAASMGAETFMLGAKKMVNKESQILFHGASMGQFTAPALGKLLAMLDDPRFETFQKIRIATPDKVAVGPPPTPMELLLSPPKRDKEFQSQALAVGFSLSELDALSVLDSTSVGGTGQTKVFLTAVKKSLDLANMANIGVFDDAIEKSKGKLTRDFIVKELYSNFEADRFVTGATLIELGIATEAPKNIFSDYKVGNKSALKVATKKAPKVQSTKSLVDEDNPL